MHHLGEGEERKIWSHNVKLTPCCEPRAKQVDDPIGAGVANDLYAASFKSGFLCIVVAASRSLLFAAARGWFLTAIK